MKTDFNFDQVIDRRTTDATKYAELLEKYGRNDLLPMWIADMDFASPTAISDALMDCARQPVLGYTTAPESFWQSIVTWLSERHGWNIKREDIDFVPGVKKGLGLCINYFTKPGDNIVIQPPVYHSFRSVIEGNGRHAVDNPLLYGDGNYSMDFEGLEKVIADTKPVMMIICNPHNQIGIQWNRDTLNHCVEICRRHNMLVLSDEIYGDLVFKQHSHTPTASLSPEAAEITITLGAPSKTFNIPGIATAWAAVPSPKLRDGFFKWLHASEFDTPPIDAIYATRAAYSCCAPWLNAVLEYLNENAKFARDFIEKHLPGVIVSTPDAGFGLWINFNPTGLSHDRLTDIFINEARLALSDGANFGSEGSGFVRLNIGVPRCVLIKGLEQLADALKGHITQK